MSVRYGVVLFSALALYGVGRAPGAVWQDGGLFQYRVWHNDLEGFEGLAVSHPLYHIVAVGAPRVNEQTVEELMKERPVYVVSKRRGYWPAFLLGDYSLTEAGVLWRVASSAPAEAG